jgi:hypothetical protein
VTLFQDYGTLSYQLDSSKKDILRFDSFSNSQCCGEVSCVYWAHASVVYNTICGKYYTLICLLFCAFSPFLFTVIFAIGRVLVFAANN